MRAHFLIHLGALLCVVAGMTASVAAGNAPANAACLECHSEKTLTKTGSNGKETSLFVEQATLQHSVHGKLHCTECHPGITNEHPDNGVTSQPVSCAGCHKEQSESFGASVHGIALAKGSADAATCVDCHGKHDILNPTSSESPLHYSRLGKTCGECHEQESKDFEASVHAHALEAGHREAPTCTDCHSEHKINSLQASSPLKISADVCSNCHASERLNTKYRMPGDRVKTFFESYHGLAAQYGSTLAANCGSCHGFHKVLPSSDPASSVHPSNLVSTCGKCHPGATENFAKSKIHVDPEKLRTTDSVGEKLNHWIRKIYILLICFTIGAMLLHNGLVFGRKLLNRYRSADFSVPRMSKSQRIQHATLAISFIVLAITGFALKFPDGIVGRAMGSSEAFRSWTHRVAGIVLILAGLYHVIYLITRKEGRTMFLAMLPRLVDVIQPFQYLFYLVGVRKAKPAFGRFGYAEKLEYWAVVWGTIVMGITGLVIWFKVEVTHFLPRWAVEIAVTIHYLEAILACLAILVWHFYHVIFDPDVYPINWACWNGRVSKHWQKEEHPGDDPADPN